MATGGLLQWANGIRLTMATDPGRALFKEQVQMHGFSFLDDYLDNILLNVKQDALIELVKTPGRKRTLTKKPKPASKLKQGITLFSEDEERCQTMPQEVSMGADSNSQQHQAVPELAAHAAQVKTPNPVLAQVSHDNVLTISEATTSTLIDSLPRGNINELSTIAEDDEIAERSRVSLASDATVVQLQEVRETSVSVNPPANNSLSRCNVESATKVAEPQISPVALHDSDLAQPRANSPPIPSLPTLVPLRKSMTTSMENPTGMGAATPGGPVPGKRTSWLQKARQAKALEIAGKKATSSLSSLSLLQPTSTALLPSNMKRKSDGFSGPGEDDDERHHKVAKTTITDTAPTQSNLNVAADGGSSHLKPARTASPLPLEEQQLETRESGEGDMLNLLKKTVEGLGSRTGKGTGKSLGGPAATALAEARAAAEARIAERNMKEEQTMNMAHYHSLSLKPAEEHGEPPLPEPRPLSAEQDSRSLNPSSELNPADQPNVVTSKMPNKSVFNIGPAAGESESRTTTTTVTTPPNSPPLSRDVFRPPPGPVFNKPPPIFVPPNHVKVARDQMEKDNQPSSSKDSFATKATLESALSDAIFSSKDRSTPVWTLGTQDPLYSNLENTNVCDEDDSWPIDDKLEEGVQWVYENAKDDNTTWSSLPSQQNTGNLSEDMLKSGHGQENQNTPTNVYTGGSFADVYDTDVIQRDGMQNAMSDSEQDEASQDATISLIESSKVQSQSQVSNSTSSSQQSNVGFFGQATKLISNMMGSGKNAKPGVKNVLQKAAVAAKKQQEETDKKATRLREMETRRQQAMQRKAEEEKARVIEQEKKLKEENERRKREREELTDKRPVKATGSRKEDDTIKKRKIEVEKKPDVKRSAVNPPKSSVKLAIKQPSALSSSTVYNSSFNTHGGPAVGSKPGETGIPKPGTTAQGLPKGKGKMTVKAVEDDLPQPSQIVRTQMAARAKAQLRAADQANEASVIPSESIELPDINSEYSDSEDEDRQRTFDPPDWAQSPELMQALQQQSTINPDDIFGAIRPLRMEEIFKTRTSRFRARTSSANWVGADRLTAEEEREYARRMGFK